MEGWKVGKFRTIQPEGRFLTFQLSNLPTFHLTSRDSADDQERLRARRDRVGQRGVRKFVGQILRAGKEPDERSALLRDVVADRPAQHRIAGLERIEDRALRRRPFDVELHLPVDLREPAGWRRTKNRIATILMWTAFACTLIPLGFVMFTVIQKGATAINWQFLTGNPIPVNVAPPGAPGGFQAAVVGTLIITGFAALSLQPNAGSQGRALPGEHERRAR